MGGRLSSGVFWAWVAISSAIAFLGAVVVFAITVPFDRRRWVLHRYTCAWASLYTLVNPAWTVVVTGRERLDDRTPSVLVSNHQSMVDILVLFRLFRHFKWVSKASNFRLPFIGWNMWLNGYVPLTRGDRDSVQRMFAACRTAIAGGSSVMLFPEGTRSPDGTLRTFKSGAFELALRAGCPVVPIAIDGSARALPKRGFTLRRATVRVTVLEPWPTSALVGATAEALAQRAESEIRAALDSAVGSRHPVSDA